MNKQLKMPLKEVATAVKQAFQSNFYSLKYTNFSERISCGINQNDFLSLPFTTKEELRTNDSFRFLCTPYSEVRRMHTSSGTHGNPTLSFYSDLDLNVWKGHLIRAFKMANLLPGDVFQVIVGFGLFSGGLGFEYAAEAYGMTVIPIGMGNTRRQVDYLRTYKVNGIITISSYLPILADYLKTEGIDPKTDLCLKSILIGAESFDLSQRQELKNFFGVPILSVYGMSEMEGPGVAVECTNEGGMHIFSDAYFPEIIDPYTLEPVDLGVEGELVLTSLKRECMPLIRYRTGDMTRLLKSDCNCDSPYEWKIDYIRCRCDDMFIVKGVNIYPSQISNIISYCAKTAIFLQIEISKNDQVTLVLTNITDEPINSNFEYKLKKEIKEWLYINVDIIWRDKQDFINNASIGKTQLVVDKRDL